MTNPLTWAAPVLIATAIFTPGAVVLLTIVNLATINVQASMTEVSMLIIDGKGFAG